MKLYLTIFLITLTLSVSGQNILAEHHFESENITEVSVVGSFCDVYVTKGDKVVFDGVIEGNGDKDDFLIASMKRGSEVIFKVERKKDFNFGWQNIKKARFDITIPDGTILSIDNTSGDVRVDGLSADGFKIETTSGDIYLKDLTGRLGSRSTSGDAVIDGVTGNVVFQSTSGDQEFRDIIGNLETRATSGDIDIIGVKGNLAARATSGDMELRDVEGSVSLGTTSGNIEGENILLTADSDARSTSGDIYLEFINDLEEIGFDLDATSGDLEVGSIDGEDRLILKRGKIRFSGNSTSGDQVYTN